MRCWGEVAFDLSCKLLGDRRICPGEPVWGWWRSSSLAAWEADVAALVPVRNLETSSTAGEGCNVGDDADNFPEALWLP